MLTFSFSVPGSVYRNEGSIAAYHADLLQRLLRIPGVVAAGETSLLPLGYRTVDVTTYDVDIDGRPIQPGAVPDNANFRIVSPGFFEAARTPLLRGRAFVDGDIATRPAVAIVNEAMARTYWPDGALGRVFRLRERYGRRDLLSPIAMSSAPITVIGVVHDAKQTVVIDACPARFFLPPPTRVRRARDGGDARDGRPGSAASAAARREGGRRASRSPTSARSTIPRRASRAADDVVLLSLSRP